MRLFILFLLFPIVSEAGFVEIGAAGSYRKSFIPSTNGANADSYDEGTAISTSVAYYFAEMTAFEVTYTQGQSKRFIDSDTTTATTIHSYALLGTDLVWTFGKRGDNFIPYLKVGVAYFLKKRIEYDYENKNSTTNIGNTDPIELDQTLVPSLGFGMKFKITKQLAFKVGVDLWTSGSIDKNLDQFDWAGKLGLSWIF